MTKKRAMAILGNVNLLQQIAYTWTKKVRYHTRKGKPPFKTIRITKTQAVAMIMRSDVVFGWRSSGDHVTFWTQLPWAKRRRRRREMRQRCAE